LAQSQRPIPTISVCGRSKVGKTTFLVKLISELTSRGYRVGVIKHSIHAFSLSEPGRDTWRHMQAGAQAVAFSSDKELALTRRLDRDLGVDQIAATLGEVDLVLTEGYKQADKPKIEVSRAELGTELVCRRQEIIAVVSDHPTDLDVPHFDLDDAPGVATLLESLYLG
jgi:molybdopterin-guanine dinucleotide biosynthesis protein B